MGKRRNRFVSDGPFLRLPHWLLDHPVRKGLSPRAFMLLVDIARRYNGKNNGDLSAAPSIVGWKSHSNLSAARRELLDVGLIVETRSWMKPRRCALYAMIWFGFDWIPSKHEISPAAFADAVSSFKKRLPPVVIKPSHDPQRRSATSSPKPTRGPMEAETASS